MNRKIGIIIVAFLILPVVLFGCNKPDVEVLDDEIALQIQLDIKEDIGLLVVDYEANGSGGSGGTSNADKSLLQHDELIIYTLSKQDFDDLSNGDTISIQFTIITEYIDPNYENIYPIEYTKTMDEISLETDFGKSYFFTISGDKTNGYKAVLDK